MFLAIAILLPKSKSLFESGELPLLCFDVSPVLWDKTLRTFSVRLIPAGSKELSWMVFLNDIMARLTAMFHAVSVNQNGWHKVYIRHLLNPLTHWDDCVHSHTCTHTVEPVRVLPLKHLFPPFLCLHVFDFSCATKLLVSYMRQLAHKEITMQFPPGSYQ